SRARFWELRRRIRFRNSRVRGEVAEELLTIKSFEFRREMSQDFRRRRDSIPSQLIFHRRRSYHGLRDVIDVRLRVDPPRDRETDEVHRRGGLRPIWVKAEHDRAD